MTPVSVSKDAQTVEIQSTNVEKATSSSVQTSFTPTSLSNTSASNNENIPAVIDSDSSSTMNVSASEFTPTTTLPETSVSNPYPATSVPPTLAGVSLVIPQLGVNMGQASFDPGQTSSDISLPHGRYFRQFWGTATFTSESLHTARCNSLYL